MGAERNQGPTLRKRRIPIPAPRARSLVVVHATDGSSGRRFDLNGAVHLFGRGEGGSGFDDPRMSREHARVAPGDAPHSHVVEDLGTTNGTYLDGRRLEGREQLEPNRVLSMGDTILVVDQEPDPDLLPASPQTPAEEIAGLVGISFTSQRLRRSIATVAHAKGAILLLGPTGSGKEVAARAVHRISGRTGAFVAVNCAAIPAELAESEFFGHEKGAFTGADSRREGHFTLASGGTLFLDEVGDLPPPLQAKLLRVLEDGVVQPIGGGAPRSVDFRIIAATNVDVHAAGFREDLLARLGDWTLRIPGLAERRADVLALFRHFAERERRGIGVELTSEFAQALLLHPWSGNVRELLKLVLRLTALVPEEELFDLIHLPADFRVAFDACADDERTGKQPPQEELESLLRAAKGNIKRIAEQTGWNRTQIYRWLRRAKIDPDHFR